MREERAMSHEADHRSRRKLVQHRIDGALIVVIERRREKQLVDRLLQFGIGRPREQACAEMNDVGESSSRGPGRNTDDGQRIRRLA